MPFLLSPDVVPGDRSAYTVKVYKARLNRLAKAGFEDVPALLKKPSAVVKHITDTYTSNDPKKDKVRRLELLTGIMYALSAVPNDNKKKLQYKKAFDKNKTTYTSPDQIRKTDPDYKTKREAASDSD